MTIPEDTEDTGYLIFGTPKVIQAGDNVIAVTGLYHSAGRGFGVNAGIIFTPNSIVFIDSGMTIASAEFLWRTAAERIKRQNNLYLILTHHHSDHTFGMRVFKEKGAKVIAHAGVNKFLAGDNGYYKKFIAKQSGRLMTFEDNFLHFIDNFMLQFCIIYS